MKRIISVVVFFMLVSKAFSQFPDCNSVKDGTFKSVVEIDGYKDISFIYRKGDKQIEENKAKGIKMSFEVNWTSECSYELSNPKILKGTMEGVLPSNRVYVKIIKVTSEKYTTEVSSNFFDGVVVFSFSIVK